MGRLRLFDISFLVSLSRSARDLSVVLFQTRAPMVIYQCTRLFQLSIIVPLFLIHHRPRGACHLSHVCAYRVETDNGT
ncbi:hypothetical protein F4809DRAFT_589032 [Biscogniauxia mediterranea]|nr:hypothetical protein F4809DRAFT_589032 [Biscogniauxia mediterranea]